MVGGSSRNVSALLSTWKQKEMSASSGDVLRIVSFSMFSGYFPSLYLKHIQFVSHSGQTVVRYKLTTDPPDLEAKVL